MRGDPRAATWRRARRAGPCFVRDEWFRLTQHHGNLPLAAALQVTGRGDVVPRRAPRGGARGAADGSASSTSRRPGFGGGTGTYMVLAGSVVRHVPENGGFRLRQYFLAGVEGERAMLGMLSRTSSDATRW